MRTTRLLAVVQVTLLTAASAVALRGTPPEAGEAPRLAQLGALAPMEAPDEALVRQREIPGGLTRAQAFERARVQALQLAGSTAEVDPALASATWQLEGPTNIGGRVTDLAIDPNEPDTVYAAAASGGVWRSTDGGDTFEPAWPEDLLQGMGALAIGSDGTLYAGTGEASPGGGSIVFGGNGVYRSSDGGETWEHTGLDESGAIGRIVVDPNDPKHVFVAAAGDLFVPGGQRGVYESVDGGDTWQQVLAGENDTTGAVDLALDPDDPDTLLVAMWDHIRRPEERIYGGPGSKVLRTEDGGDTWSEVSGLPTGVGRIGVALAPGLPSVAYAIVNTIEGPFEGFYKSVDGGESWVKASTVDPLGLYYSQSTFGWWFGRLWVDPIDPNRVFIAGVSLTSSSDGGLTFTPHLGPHADQHAMAWDPHDPTRVWLGNDGGVYRSTTRGLVNTDWTVASYQPWTQSYTIDVSQQDPTRLVAGMQDNGCLRSYEGEDGGAPDGWNSYCGGDGEMTLINPTDQMNVFGCSQYGNCSRSTDGGDSTSRIGSTASDRRNWTTPLAFDPNDPSVMYYAGDVVNRSTDNGVSWTAISPDLSKGPGTDAAGYPFGTAFTIAVAATDSDTIWVGYDDGTIAKTEDLGASWTRVRDPLLPDDVWVSRVVIDPADADHVYVTYTGFRQGIDAAHVYETRDGGDTWAEISGDLPNAPVNDLLLIGDALVVGTDVGVFLSRDGGERWLRAGSGLPMAPVMDLAYNVEHHRLVVGTFGRSLWSLTLPLD